MPNPFLTQQLAREKAVQRYLTALENGDFSTIDSVWQKADGDPALEELLFNLHETFPNGQELLAWDKNTLSHEKTLFKKEKTLLNNDNSQGKESGSINSFPSGKRPSARPQKRGSVLMRTLAAILFVAFLVGGFLAVHTLNDSRLTHPKPTSTPTPTDTPKPTQAPLVQLPPLCQVTLPALYQTHTSLNDMLPLSNDDIWLVGSSQGQPLALHWNGTKWNSLPVPAPAGSSLASLAALSPNDIWAIGKTDYGSGTPNGNAQPSHTLIEHWNGTRWTHVASPDLLPSMVNELHGITVIAPNNVWVVGAAGNDIAKSGYGNRNSPLLEHWDGTRWQLIQLPTIQNAGLDSIVALNANDIWAVGALSDNNGNNQSPLLVHWNGQSWNQAASQTINDGALGRLLKITTDASHNLWTLGFDRNGMPLLLSLNNGKWASFPVPNTFTASDTATVYHQFRGLFITNSQDIWLAGETVQTPKTAGDTTFTPLVEHWDGHQWQAVTERYHGQASLQAISVSSSIVWSSGYIDYYGQPFIVTTCK